MEGNWHSGQCFLLNPARKEKKHWIFEGILSHTHLKCLDQTWNFTWVLTEECGGPIAPSEGTEANA